MSFFQKFECGFHLYSVKRKLHGKFFNKVLFTSNMAFASFFPSQQGSERQSRRERERDRARDKWIGF